MGEARAMEPRQHVEGAPRPLLADQAHLRRARDVEGASRPNARAEAHVERPVDHVIAELAGRQDGAVARVQLLALGLTREAVAHRLRTGRLHLLHRGVYAVGHLAITTRTRRRAALLAAGSGAVLTCRSAAVVWGLLPDDENGSTHVLCPSGHRRPQPGLRLHHGSLAPLDRRVRDGFAITSVARALLDLAACAPSAEVERAVEEAQVRRLVRPDEVLARAAGRRGATTLRTLLTDDPHLTRSEAERRFLALVARAGLPRPHTNVRVEGFEVDALWPDRRLVVEVDGYAYHSSRAAFERDRRRDAALRGAGYRVERITWRVLARQPEAVVAQVAAALAR